MAEVELRDGERIDDLECSGLKIIQDPKRFCFGMDAVLLSGFAKVPEGGEVVDYCTGTGIIPILMSAKTKAKHFTCVELQPESADMANRSILLNDLQERLTLVEANLLDAASFIPAGSMDAVTVNPPYLKEGSGIVNPSSAKAIARHELSCSLMDILQESARALKSGGHFYMVHRPFRLAEILSSMQKVHLEPKRIRFVYPRVDAEPVMLLVEGMKGAGSGMVVEKPLIIYDENGQYTKELKEDYKY